MHNFQIPNLNFANMSNVAIGFYFSLSLSVSLHSVFALQIAQNESVGILCEACANPKHLELTEIVIRSFDLRDSIHSQAQVLE